MVKKNHRRKPTREYRAYHAVTVGLQCGNKLALMVLLFLGALAVYALSIPEKRELERLETKLSERLIQAEKAESHRDLAQQEIQWLNTEPAYIELLARDRNDLYLEGETIARIQRSSLNNIRRE